MNHVLPHHGATFGLIVVGAPATLVLGFGISRLRSLVLGRCLGWLLLAAATACTIWLVGAEPPLVQIYTFIAVLYPPMKALMSVETQALGEPRLKPLNWFAFAAGWPGMRPAIFATLGNPPLRGAGNLVWYGVSRTALGLVLFFAARGLWLTTAPWLGELAAAYLATTLLIPGVSLILHFGVPNVIGGGWRYLGVDCRTLFRTPFQSHSLTEFWGRRWNLAFIEVTTFTIYRPLGKVLGSRLALVASFLWSGLVHELIFSVPVRSGYGLPTLYFLLHGTLVFIERGLERLGWPISRAGWLGQVWTFVWVGAPLLVCIPRAFFEQVFWPIPLGMGPSGTSLP